MSTPTPPGKPGNNNVIIIVAAVVGVVVILAITSVAIAIEDGARAASMIGLIVAPLATLLAFFGLFVNVQSIKADVSRSLEQTTELTNGLGDAKFRAAVADVLPDHMIDPAIRDQIVRDRARRARSVSAAEAAAALVEPHAYDDPDLD